MSEVTDRLKAFVAYAKPLGDEKGEAQVFCDRLFQAFGHGGYKEAHAKLDTAVRSAYGMSPKADPLQFLLTLNAAVADAEAKGDFVQPPGLPASAKNRAQFVTKDCISA